MQISPDETACEVLEVVPVIMSVIRAEVRAHRSADLSVPQFRVLAYLNRSPGASLSELAEQIGLTLPSMSKLVDGLVGRKLLTRETMAGDRRCVTLGLTIRGRSTLRSAYASAQAHLSKRLSVLPEGDRLTVVRALKVLRPLFAQERPAQSAFARRHDGNNGGAGKSLAAARTNFA